jgi:hypothetical protein
MALYTYTYIYIYIYIYIYSTFERNRLGLERLFIHIEIYLLRKANATTWSTFEKSCLGQHGLERVRITHSTVQPFQAPQFAGLGFRVWALVMILELRFRV